MTVPYIEQETAFPLCTFPCWLLQKQRLHWRALESWPHKKKKNSMVHLVPFWASAFCHLPPHCCLVASHFFRTQVTRTLFPGTPPRWTQSVLFSLLGKGVFFSHLELHSTFIRFFVEPVQLPSSNYHVFILFKDLLCPGGDAGSFSEPAPSKRNFKCLKKSSLMCP